MNGQAAYLGLSNMVRQEQWAQMGLLELGDVAVTLPEDSPVYSAGELDRIRFVDTQERFDSILTRGGNDRLWSSGVRVERISWLLDGQQIIGGLPRVASDGALTWPSPLTSPPVGTTFVVSGWRNPEYFVWQSLVQSRFHHAGRRLPRRVVLRRFDLFRR